VAFRFKPRGSAIGALLAAACLLPGWAAASSIKADEEVVFFPTAAHLDDESKAWILPVHGWIFEPEQDSVWRKAAIEELLEHLELDPAVRDNERFRERAGMFLADNERGKKLEVRLAGRTFALARSEANGHFTGLLRLEQEQLSDLAGNAWLPVEAVMPEGDRRQFTGRVQLLPPEGLSVISDIDDTIKISVVTDKRELLANTFLREFRDVPGMARAYGRWAEAGAAFHYVSSSPWQLFPVLSTFMARREFPLGAFHLRSFRPKDQTFFNLFAATEDSKIPTIESILRAYPDRKFVLVGDSGEKDPEVYGTIARRHRGQVIHAFVRDVSPPQDEQGQRFAAAFAGVPESNWTVFRAAEDLMRVDLKDED
jgi:phosphatidate phosphatase APP1